MDEDLVAQSMSFSLPYMQCYLTTDDGVLIPFWTNTLVDGTATASGGDVLKYTGLTSIPFVNDLTIHFDLAQMPTITITLTPPYRDALTLMNSDIFNWGKVGLMAQVGYAGKGGSSSQVFSGVMLMPNATFGENVTITLTSQGAFSLYTNKKNNQIAGKKTRKELLEELLKGDTEPRTNVNSKGKIDKMTVNWGEVDKDPNSEEYKYWTDIETDFMFQGQVPMSKIVEMIEHSNCYFRAANSIITILPRTIPQSDEPTRVFTVMDYPQGVLGNGFFPIFSISTPSKGVFLPGVKESLVTNQVSDDKAPKPPSVANNKTALNPIVTPGAVSFTPSGTTPSTDPNTTNFIHTISPKDFYKVKAYKKRISDEQAVDIQLETIGIPDIIPSQLVYVDGCSIRLDGTYMVTEVTHKFNASGLSTTLQLRAPALKINKSEGVAPPVADVKKKPVPSDLDQRAREAIYNGIL